MIVIRFANEEAELEGLGFLAGRFPFTALDSGEVLVPDPALAALAVERIKFSVEGPATYDQSLPVLRAAHPATVQ